MPLEGSPQARIVADSYEDEQRLVLWLSRSPAAALLEQLGYAA